MMPGVQSDHLGAIEESLESGEMESHLTDPLASWVEDSQQAEGPPAKVARRSLPSPPPAVGVEGVELVEMETVDESDVEELVVGGDLRAEVAVATPIAQGPRSKAVYFKRGQSTPASAVRKSARNSSVAPGTSALARAQQLTAEKNLEGKTAPASAIGKEKGNDFSVLDILSDSHLTSVVTDSCMMFVPSAREPEEALSIVRAKEKVQAAMAETARRLAREAETAAANLEAAGAPTAQEAADEVDPALLPPCAQGEGLSEAGASTARTPVTRAKSRPAAAEGQSAAPRSRPLRKCVKASVRAVSTRQYKRRSSK
jgi:hypothetical protein